MPRSITTNTYSVRNVAVTTTKKSHAAINWAWLRTKVSQRCLDRTGERVHLRAGTCLPCEAIPEYRA